MTMIATPRLMARLAGGKACDPGAGPGPGQFFPGREDVIRLLMEPITYANGSTLEDPALSYGIVFSNSCRRACTPSKAAPTG